MTDQKFDFSIELRSGFRENQKYLLYLKRTDEGWKGRYFGGIIDDEKDAPRIRDILNNNDGTKFTPGIGSDFVKAWNEVNEGISIDAVKSKLQKAVSNHVF